MGNAFTKRNSIASQGSSFCDSRSRLYTSSSPYFHRALEVAHRQEAEWLELRAALSLSRLWHRRGKRTRGRELIAPIYGSLAEGRDEADL